MFVYQLLIRLLSPLIWLITLIETFKRRGGSQYFFQRFGFRYPVVQTHPIWIHCASVGEIKAAEPLIQALVHCKPLLVTTNTPTGATLLKQQFGEQIPHIYCPLDWPFAIQRFLKATRPSQLWVMETEIWPNLYQLTAHHHIPISLINARLSRKTLNSPKWLQSAYQKTLALVTQILARNHEEADRFLELGAEAEKVTVLGNLKYAGLIDLPSYTDPILQPFVLLASSHPSEELAITQLWLKLQRAELLVIVPRHPKRIKDILKELNSYRQLLAVFSLGESITDQTRIYIDDQIGELMPLYAHAKLVIMGGSFVAKGGHNILEPSALAAAIITGKDMSDFEMETEQLKANHALIQCKNYRELQDQIRSLIDDDQRRRHMGESAQQIVLAQQHILTDYLRALKVNLTT